nr:lysine-rich arabinogalactan protein 19-like [Aegilops tauschii subsp. strangulata]
MEVHKGQKTSQIGGDDWNRFINYMHLTGGELISFSFRRETPRLAVIYINNDEHADPLDEALYAKGIRLSEDESGNLWYILPPRDDYVGMPFVTRLTRTNVCRHVMGATCLPVETSLPPATEPLPASLSPAQIRPPPTSRAPAAATIPCAGRSHHPARRLPPPAHLPPPPSPAPVSPTLPRTSRHHHFACPPPPPSSAPAASVLHAGRIRLATSTVAPPRIHGQHPPRATPGVDPAPR